MKQHSPTKMLPSFIDETKETLNYLSKLYIQIP